jgi:hypothetical protein
MKASMESEWLPLSTAARWADISVRTLRRWLRQPTDPLDEAEIDRLALLPSLEYGQIRKPLAKRLGLSVSFLDETIERRQKRLCPVGPPSAGRPLELPVLLPANDPVNGQALFQQLIEIMTEYVVLPEHAAVAIALWIFRAHCDDQTRHRLSLEQTAFVFSWPPPKQSIKLIPTHCTQARVFSQGFACTILTAAV